jgi:hypothetical protein
MIKDIVPDDHFVNAILRVHKVESKISERSMKHSVNDNDSEIVECKELPKVENTLISLICYD